MFELMIKYIFEWQIKDIKQFLPTLIKPSLSDTELK